MDDGMKIESVFSKYTGQYTGDTIETVEDDATNSYMSFDSYLKLIVAQMQNQDFNDPMDDSEVLAQMAQYSMLEGIKNMTQQSSVSYATSLVGKIVTVDGESGLYTGKVNSITVEDGKAQLIIDGEAYDSAKVTDIVSEDIFNNLLGYIGKTVRSIDAEDPETAPTAVITNVLFMGGEGYAVVNAKLVPIKELVVVENAGSTGTETGGTEEGGTEEGDTVTETSEVQSAEAMSTYSARTDSLIDEYMKELDRVGGVAGASAAGTAAASAAAETSGPSFEEYTVETVRIEVPDYAAGVFGDNEILSGTVSADGIDKTFASGSGTLTREVDSVKLAANIDLDPTTAERTSSGKLKGVTTEKGVSKGDCVPHRISVEAYPEEAALADELGTRMYDIRFINNHAVTSRIKTGEVIGHTSGGKAITEIGYSGVGQLGEVVTFADGTQRVEVLLKNGHSCWLNTSGNYTLDEICTKNGAPGSLTGKLTGAEGAIRHFSDPFSEMDQSFKESFNNTIERLYGTNKYKA